ncbi:MAG: sulfotransferase domain-containing protein [Candidatus Pacebacteria bacterium]|nr:sulfotransferase domain-containing protein [Candidatus Paceibacterota bacterium]
MIVLCTGMVRSASTWSYNVARLLLSRHSENIASGYSDDIGRALKEAKNAEHIIIKCHRPDQLGRQLIEHRACLTLHSYRNPLEALASSVESFTAEFDRHLAAVSAGLESLQFELEAGGVHFIWFEEVITHPLNRIAAIAEYLGLEAGPDIITEVAKALSREAVSKTAKSLSSGDKKIPIGNFDFKNSSLIRSGLIRDKPRSLEAVLNKSQMARAKTAFKGLTREEGDLLDLVKNLGSIETYYHDGQAYLQGEEPVEKIPLANPLNDPPAPALPAVSSVAVLPAITGDEAEEEIIGIPILSQNFVPPDDFDLGFYVVEKAKPTVPTIDELKAQALQQLPAAVQAGGPRGTSDPLAESQTLEASGARPNPARLAALGGKSPDTVSRPRGIPLSQRRPGINEVI